jgi:hypothetical protein
MPLRLWQREMQQEPPKAGYEPGRLRRGAARAVKKLGPHQYAVAGTEERVYHVNLELDTPCTCKDAEFHGRGCLHELAARLHDGDADLIMGLGQMLLAKEKRTKKDAGKGA